MEIVIPFEELPYELGEVRSQLEEVPALEALLTAKDAMIWRLLSARAVGQTNVRVSSEIGEWTRLAEQYQREVDRYDMICEYCNIQLDPNTVNSNCPRNLVGDTAKRHNFIYKKGKVSYKTPLHLEPFSAKYKVIKKKLKKSGAKGESMNAADFVEVLEKLGYNQTDIDYALGEAGASKGTVDYRQFLARIKPV
jgi:hypothetical protein